MPKYSKYLDGIKYMKYFFKSRTCKVQYFGNKQ